MDKETSGELQVSHHDESNQIDSNLPDEYRGTATDRHDMEVMGKKQVLRRNFRFFAMLGFASTAMVGWESFPVLILYPLIDGGPANVFWGLIAAIVGMPLVYASIAEVASIYPTAGGQYHWVSELAPPGLQRGLSYSVGWLTAIGWQVYLTGICFIDASLIQGLVAFNVPGYEPQRWHSTLLTIAVMLFSVSFNTVLAKRLPFLEGAAMFLHLVGLFAVVIPLWATATLGDAHEVLLRFQDNGGWSDTGLSAMIGVVIPIAFLVGCDCCVHMSEETLDASRVVPNAIMASVPINAIMNLIMGLTLIFCLGSAQEFAESTELEPFIHDIYYRATGSYAGTNTMVAIHIVLLSSGCISELATSSRQLWAFSRDRALPGWTWLSYVSPGWNIPVRCVCASVVITVLLSLINIGSSVALNAINSLGSVSILCSYYITISCLVWRRVRGAPLPPRRWSLGRYGLGINVLALLFLTPVVFFDFWPLAQPVTAENLNWSPVMFVGILGVAAVYYLVRARFEYSGPVAQAKREE